ncbi:hypothetical protein AB4Z18_18025 [Leifsonia sp. 2TAF2]|uniref:DUF7507 domain-containing protein n=1 Tax=Leifsonia sp. 2TAF2 TaxID=3233009 RepID=UPI003F98AAD9
MRLPRRWSTTMVAAACVAVGALVATLVLPEHYANAATTGVSTIYKTATNTRTGSVAASSDAPGGAKTGTARPGDKLKWVTNYQNNTTANASVNLKDVLTTAGTYVPGSLQLPPNQNAAGTFSPAYSTNGGTSWATGTPPSNANGVGFTGTVVPQGTQQLSVNVPSPVSQTLSNAGGDGYNAVVSADGLRVYAVFHHQAISPGAGGQPIYCAVILTGAVCPGWPATNVYAQVSAGVPINSGVDPLVQTSYQNGTFIANNKLFYGYQRTVAPYSVGIGCIDLGTLTTCAPTEYRTATGTGYGGSLAGTGLPATNGKYYFLDQAGFYDCFDAAAIASCGSVNSGYPAASNDGRNQITGTYGNYVFGVIDAAGKIALTCFNAATSQLCAGFVSPAIGGSPSWGPHSILVPVLTGTSVSGVCSLPAPGYAAQCFNLVGTSIANPYPVNFGAASAGLAGDAYTIGTKVYLPYANDGVGCFDFSSNLPCAGFTRPSNVKNYTVRSASAFAPNCLVADGDGHQIAFFNAITGGGCVGVSGPTTMTVTPVTSYCGSGSAGFTGWGALSIPGLVPGTYTNSTVTLRDQNNNVITGFNGVTLAAGGTLSLAAIPTTVTSITATVVVNGVNDPSGVTSGQVAITWSGLPPEMCFQTTAPPVACDAVAPVTLSNTANAVTTSAAGSDAPGGNTTGVTRFTVSPDVSNTSSQCEIGAQKVASVQTARPGDKVTYTIFVGNAGSQAYNNAKFTDDLSDVLKDATYNGDAATDFGTVSYSAPTLAWSGALPAAPAPGNTATITYSVTIKSPDTGDHSLVNTVVTDNPGIGICNPGSVSPNCTVTIPVSDLSLTKSANSSGVQSPARVGDTIGYTFSATNTGGTTLTGVAITDPHPGLSALTYTWPGVPGTLLAGQTVTATATYTLTQADVNSGAVPNSAIVAGNPPTGPPVTSTPADANVPLTQGPSLALTKTANASGVSNPAKVGDVLAYTFTSTNTGNVTMTGVTVTDLLPGLSPLIYTWPGTPGTLLPGQSVTATATYDLTESDLSAGHVANAATATGLSPSGDPLTTPPASVDTPLAPELALPTVSG